MKHFNQKKNGNVAANLLKAGVAISLCVFFAACGGDSGNSGGSNSEDALQVESGDEPETDSIPTYESEDDLPNCTKSREGEIVELSDERKAYICKDGRWEFDHVILESVKTEDDLSACVSKNEGDSVWVKEESAIFVCMDRKWEKLETEEENTETGPIPTYESEDDLPNCTKDRKGNLAQVEDEAMLCNDGKWQNVGTVYETSDSIPKCSKRREGKTAFVLDEFQALVCTDGTWKEDAEVEEIVVKPEVKSSSSGKSDGKSSSSGKNKEESSSSGEEDLEASSSSSNAEEPPKSSSARSNVKTDTFKDSRDGKTYKTVKIGDQVWFAENLNYNDGHGLCPMKNAKNCEKYGRLYNFEDPKTEGPNAGSDIASLCPDGWHLPDSLDWIELISYVSANNGDEPVGASLKASTGWFSEGDTVDIEGSGTFLGSKDSTRIGATRGTDRFGFSAFPAGSCWDDGTCYVGDDTRFYFMNRQGTRGGSFKLAFDKDDMMYSQDGAFGWVSVRCMETHYLKIDSMPPIDVIDSLLWMVGDLSYKGSTEFTLHTAFYACPAGWRLPTQDEIRKAIRSGKFTIPVDDGEVEYFAMDGYGLGSAVGCYSFGGCYEKAGDVKNSERRIRCVHEDKLTSVSGCACKASEYDSTSNSITWSVSGCKDGSYKVSGYSWDFGSDSAGVKVSGAKATKTFDSFTVMTPLVSVNSSVEVDGKDYAFAQKLTCPTIRAGSTDAAIVFKKNEMKMLYEGVTLKAKVDGECNEYQDPRLECKSSSGKTISATVSGKTYSSTGYVLFVDLDRSICSGEISLSVSEDMECSISY